MALLAGFLVLNGGAFAAMADGPSVHHAQMIPNQADMVRRPSARHPLCRLLLTCYSYNFFFPFLPFCILKAKLAIGAYQFNFATMFIPP